MLAADGQRRRCVALCRDGQRMGSRAARRRDARGVVCGHRAIVQEAQAAVGRHRRGLYVRAAEARGAHSRRRHRDRRTGGNARRSRISACGAAAGPGFIALPVAGALDDVRRDAFTLCADTPPERRYVIGPGDAARWSADAASVEWLRALGCDGRRRVPSEHRAADPRTPSRGRCRRA